MAEKEFLLGIRARELLKYTKRPPFSRSAMGLIFSDFTPI